MKQPAKSRAIAAAFPFELIAAAMLFLMLAAFALPATAAQTRTTGLYTENFSYGRSFKLDGSASGLGEESRATLARQAIDKTFLLSGTVYHPTVFGTRECPMNLYMSAGAGVAVQDRSYIETASRTGVAPAFRVGMGIKYSF